MCECIDSDADAQRILAPACAERQLATQLGLDARSALRRPADTVAVALRGAGALAPDEFARQPHGLKRRPAAHQSQSGRACQQHPRAAAWLAGDEAALKRRAAERVEGASVRRHRRAFRFITIA